MEFTLKLFTKLDSYRLATFIICIGTEALNMHSGLPCASNVEKGGILTNMMSQADSSSSASVPSPKQRRKYSSLKF